MIHVLKLVNDYVLKLVREPFAQGGVALKETNCIVDLIIERQYAFAVPLLLERQVYLNKPPVL